MDQIATPPPLPLSATTRFPVVDPAALIAEACRLYAEFGEVAAEGGRGRIETVFGRTHFETVASGELLARVEASDAVNLAYVKMGLAETVAQCLADAAPSIRWDGDDAGLRVPPFFREMRVASARPIAPRMRRIRLAGENLARFGENGLHVRLLFPPAGREPLWPHLREDGRIAWPCDEDRLETRVYTIRRMDAAAGWVDVDIVIHEGDQTPGSAFALGAQPGDRVGMTGPGGGEAPLDRPLFLFGDETALPAIARILEMLPEGVPARAVIEVDGPEDELPLASRPGIETRWLHRAGRPAGTAGLLPQAVRACDLDALGEDAFIWAAGEFSDFRAMRAHLRTERRWPREHHLVVSYWRRGSSGNDPLPTD
ncbi:siderophore-interacting protein [Aureimonas jatrophae]|uniref:NADPH-dependent ferric siderophore reductase, contains FAD-binding and SIP domains n=1 Tax=Aureimonas jatrophae TaxID=1166073 RepID=A0A1H0LWT8_9HYPH|nr:siderophore-interacting protein [Aureimonas jatrophae]MBB3952780.1 NADPH-dependent ferric siderophore reductase [Aureimonas jatrophae]SDO72543.1 NADPH-dependent ferric siderophore reductase, contains FAD-binding and SIP domains [Aureimonas jatrophae]